MQLQLQPCDDSWSAAWLVSGSSQYAKIVIRVNLCRALPSPRAHAQQSAAVLPQAATGAVHGHAAPKAHKSQGNPSIHILTEHPFVSS